MKIVDLRPGLQVLHPEYGLGDVKILTEKTAEVLFNEGRKTLSEEMVTHLKPAEPTAQEKLLMEIRDLLKAQAASRGEFRS